MEPKKVCTFRDDNFGQGFVQCSPPPWCWSNDWFQTNWNVVLKITSTLAIVFSIVLTTSCHNLMHTDIVFDCCKPHRNLHVLFKLEQFRFDSISMLKRASQAHRKLLSFDANWKSIPKKYL